MLCYDVVKDGRMQHMSAPLILGPDFILLHPGPSLTLPSHPLPSSPFFHLSTAQCGAYLLQCMLLHDLVQAGWHRPSHQHPYLLCHIVFYGTFVTAHVKKEMEVVQYLEVFHMDEYREFKKSMLKINVAVS